MSTSAEKVYSSLMSFLKGLIIAIFILATMVFFRGSDFFVNSFRNTGEIKEGAVFNYTVSANPTENSVVVKIFSKSGTFDEYYSPKKSNLYSTLLSSKLCSCSTGFEGGQPVITVYDKKNVEICSDKVILTLKDMTITEEELIRNLCDEMGCIWFFGLDDGSYDGSQNDIRLELKLNNPLSEKESALY